MSSIRKTAFGRRLEASLFLLIPALCLPTALRSLQPTTPLANYGRQGWVMENGLPQNTVQALVQGADGFLWIGTEVGLARFDGNSFQFFDKDTNPALPGNDVRCLLAATDGSLWIGTSDGLARWKNGLTHTFSTASGLPSNTIRGLRSSGAGILVQTSAGWAEFKSDRFVPASQDSEQSDANGPFGFQAVLPDGLAAAGGKSFVEIRRGSELTARLLVGKEVPGSRLQTLFADREGSLWIGTNAGLARWANGKLQTLPVTDPLSSASILTLMEDREGDLWIGTEADGLHIFRDQRFRTWGVRDGLSSDATTTVVEDSAGTLWVGTSGFGLNAIAQPQKTAGPHVTRTWTVRNGLASDVILSLAAAQNGDLWIGTPDGLNRTHGSAVASFTSADGLPDDFIRSLLVDADGSLWIGTRRGLTHWINPGSNSSPMETFTTANGLGSNLVGAMAKDAKGELWVATFNGLSRLRGGKIENFTTANGLSSNVVTALLTRKDGTVLIGTQDHGWSLWDGQRFTAASDPDVSRRNDIHTILDDEHRHVWFATGEGLARIDCSEKPTDTVNTSGGCRNWLEFGTADGLRGRETAINSHPSAWRSRDGHLWFATPKGLVEVDPAAFPVNTVPPAVALERLAIDDTTVPLHNAQSELHIPAGHVHFEFDYAALSFVAPQKVRYRYMLEGFDHSWTDAGPRRTAYYTNIPPGTLHLSRAGRQQRWPLEPGRRGAPVRVAPALLSNLVVLCAASSFVSLHSCCWCSVCVSAAQSASSTPSSASATALRARFTTHSRKDTSASRFSLKSSPNSSAGKKSMRPPNISISPADTSAEGLADARQSIWALRSQDSGETTLPVNLRRMVEAAGGGIPADTLQPLRSLPAVASRHRARDSAHRPGGHP